MQAALMLRSKSRVARRRKLRKLGGRLELPSNVATKEIAPFPRYPPDSWCAQGRAAWQERGRRCSVQEAQQQAACHRRWVKRNRIQDASLGGSSDDEDFLGVLRGPSTFANAFLYVGLGTIALGLVIAFVGTGEKGFKTVELRLIGPSLIGLGLVCCILRILFCICPSHCISSGKKTRKKSGIKVDVDHTTSLLHGESKRVSIARGPCLQSKYPITHKRKNSKMLNEGMEALRQIATTSLFMQNEQKNSINRVVPIIKEPGDTTEAPSLEMTNPDTCSKACDAGQIYQEVDDENSVAKISLKNPGKRYHRNNQKGKSNNTVIMPIIDADQVTGSSDIQKMTTASNDTMTEATTFDGPCWRNKLSRQRVALNQSLPSSPSVYKESTDGDSLMETSLSIIDQRIKKSAACQSSSSSNNSVATTLNTGAIPRLFAPGTAADAVPYSSSTGMSNISPAPVHDLSSSKSHAFAGMTAFSHSSTEGENKSHASFEKSMFTLAASFSASDIEILTPTKEVSTPLAHIQTGTTTTNIIAPALPTTSSSPTLMSPAYKRTSIPGQIVNVSSREETASPTFYNATSNENDGDTNAASNLSSAGLRNLQRTPANSLNSTTTSVPSELTAFKSVTHTFFPTPLSSSSSSSVTSDVESHGRSALSTTLVSEIATNTFVATASKTNSAKLRDAERSRCFDTTSITSSPASNFAPELLLSPSKLCQ